MEDEDQIVAPAVEPVVEETNQAETDARQMGWTPKDDWRGNPDEWVDAEAFVRRGRDIMPILRKNNERLLNKVRQLETDMMEQKQTFGDFQKYHEQTLEQQKKATLSQLREARKEAIANSDGEAFEQIDARIKEVEAVKVDSPKPEKIEQPPEITAWFEKNAWYQDDIVLQDFANETAERLTRGRPDLKGVEFLESVKSIVQERMPHKFKNPARNGPAAVEGAAPRAPRGGKGYNDLPADAKAMCDRFVRDIPGFTRDTFISDYEWG